MIREDNWDGKIRSGDNWRRTDIGIDYPFNQLPQSDIERFPYAILEVKLQTQAGQEPPEWVRELISSHLVEAVPKFSKFIHGCCTLYPNKIDLLPYWAPQMGIDIRKPITHRFGIERPNQSASVSTSDEPSDSEDELEIQSVSEAEREPPANQTAQVTDPQRLIEYHPSGETHENGAPAATVTHPGGNGVMDEEERVAAESQQQQQQQEDYPLYDSEEEYSEEEDENTPLMRRRRRSSSIIKTLQRAGEKALHYLSYLIPRPRSTQVEIPSVISGTVYARKFKAPPGKRIFVPVRVEPKVYFAAERTFLSWFEFAIILSVVATTLLNFGGESKGALLYASLGFTITAVVSLIYAAGLYLWRVHMMRTRRAVRYHEKYGPTILCILVMAAVAINFVGALKGKTVR
jgi:uncharacterized membrane protein YidH (DUF202 family)